MSKKKTGGVKWEYPFDPLPKQKDALLADVDEVLYGGALGSGKSEVLLAACMTLCTLVPHSKALLVRRSFPELNELVERLKERIPKRAATYNKSDHIFTFSNGSQLILGYLDGEDDHERYQGFELQLVCFDELTHYRKKSYTLLISRLRASGAVQAMMRLLGIPLRALSASNPGSRGHAWVKARFIDPAPKHQVFTGDDGLRRVFIPARIYDNPFIDHEDYIRKLGALDPEMKRALIEGDWDITAGVRFSQWRESQHVIRADVSPMDLVAYPRCVAIDWGFSDPFAALWMAKLPDGTVLVYRELYATEMTNKQQARAILGAEMEGERGPERPLPLIMDPAMWRRSQGGVTHAGDKDAPPVGSAAHDYQTVVRERPIKAYNLRVPGWSQLDELLAIQEGLGYPKLQVFETCRDLIRTIGALPRDKKNPEDVDTHAEDHLADALRYGAMYLTGRHKQQRTGREGTLSGMRAETAELAHAGF